MHVSIWSSLIARGLPLGLIAGNGPLPVLVATEARARGVAVVAVGHVGETRPELEELVQRMHWVGVGELEALIHGLRRGNVQEVVMIGGIDKRRSLKDLRLDGRALKLLQRLWGRGDDSLLGALAAELEAEGMRVLSSRDLLASRLAPRGVLAAAEPTLQQMADVRLGIGVLNQVGPLDIGQTVVVKEGVILAVEAVEGTDEAIVRGGELGGGGAVVVKGSKPRQDLRFDVPAVGSGTLRSMERVGAKVLALEAGNTLLLDGHEMIETAARMEICLLGWGREAPHV
jgi:hypothetical protein